MRTVRNAAKRTKSSAIRERTARRDTTRFQRVLQRHFPELEAQYRVKALGVFGSYVRGEARPGSDLDVLVEFEVAPSFFEFIDLEDHLSDLLGVKVDLVMKSALKPAIGQRILAEVVPI